MRLGGEEKPLVESLVAGQVGGGVGGVGGGAHVQSLPCPLASSGLRADDWERSTYLSCLTSDFSIMFELFPLRQFDTLNV